MGIGLMTGYPILLLCLNALDLWMNSSFEFDEPVENDVELMVILSVLLQMFVQIFAFIAVFLMLSNTYLFQVGIIGPLFSNFRPTFIIHPVYMCATVFLGIYRSGELLSGVPTWELWDSDVYVAMSIMHKLVAVLYYYLNMNTVMKLGDASLYSKAAWVAIFSSSSIAGGTRNPMIEGTTAS